jgi:hypothetical protein
MRYMWQISTVLVAATFGCSAVTLGPEEGQQQDSIIARAPTPVAPERQKQLLGSLLLFGGGAAVGAGATWLWNNWNSPYDGDDPYHHPGDHFPPEPGHHGDPHAHHNGDPHAHHNSWGYHDPHPWGHNEGHHWGHNEGHHGGDCNPEDPSSNCYHQNEHINYKSHNPFDSCDANGKGFHDIHGNFFPPCHKDHQPHHGGFTPPDYWNGGPCAFGNNTVGQGEFGNGFQPYGHGYPSAGCGNGQYCTQSNNKAGMFKADVNGTFTFPTCPDDEDCDSVVDSQDRCSRTLPRPQSYSEDAWVWKTGPWAGCAAGQIRNTGDSDRDGVADNFDVCPDTPAFTTVAPTSKLMGCSVKQAPELKTFVMNTITVYKKLLANKKPAGKDANQQLSE